MRTRPTPECAQRNPLRVPAWMDLLGGAVERYPGWWIALGNLETRALRQAVDAVRIERPIYIAGLARAGSTMLLEILSWHADTVSHRYRDYPAVHIPAMWNWFVDRAGNGPETRLQRAHGDGIEVTSNSPEAFEEIIWMAFFRNLHTPSVANTLGGDVENRPFEAFYRDHVRKLLRVRGGSRYVAKGNYNVTRLEYLLKLFPDARYVIPVREPTWHVASLMRQHALFCRVERDDRRILRRMQRAGHFEFGLDRRPINTGDRCAVRRILKLWEEGREVEGWARYWSHVYGHVAERLEASRALREASVVVRFEDLCRAPRRVVRTLLHHCRLPPDEPLVARAAETLRFPQYYAPSFNERELETIARSTTATAARFGYGPAVRNTAP